MSKERGLLAIALIALEDAHLRCERFQDEDARLSVIEQIKELLDQPGQPEQQPMTGGEISQGFRADKDATHAESYWAGVALAEKHYGITGIDTYRAKVGLDE